MMRAKMQDMANKMRSFFFFFLLAVLLLEELPLCASDMVKFPIRRAAGGKDVAARDEERRRMQGTTPFKDFSFTKRENDGVYWIDIRIGKPEQQTFSAIIDTGSSTIAVPCIGCSCGNHNHFDMSKSTSAVKTASTYSQCYSEGSCNRGAIIQDLICMGEKCTPEEAVVHPFGCCSKFASAFQKQQADGIIGLSGTAGTLIADLRTHHLLENDLFAICFGHTNGYVSVGGYQVEHHIEPIQWVPLTAHGGFYGIKVNAVYLNNENIGVASIPEPIVDSGTSFTYLPRSVWTAVKSKFSAFCGADAANCLGTKNPSNTDRADLRDSVVCYLPPAGGDFLEFLDSFPPIEFELANKVKICVPASTYFFRSSHGIYCVGFFADRRFIIGAITMAEFNVIFDHGNNRMGWARANCDDEPQEVISHRSACCGSCLAASGNANAGSTSSSPSNRPSEPETASPTVSLTAEPTATSRTTRSPATAEAGEYESLAPTAPTTVETTDNESLAPTGSDSPTAKPEVAVPSHSPIRSAPSKYPTIHKYLVPTGFPTKSLATDTPSRQPTVRHPPSPTVVQSTSSTHNFLNDTFAKVMSSFVDMSDSNISLVFFVTGFASLMGLVICLCVAQKCVRRRVCGEELPQQRYEKIQY